MKEAASQSIGRRRLGVLLGAESVPWNTDHLWLLVNSPPTWTPHMFCPLPPFSASWFRLLHAAGMLVRNYRSHERLLELPSRMFYSSALVAAASPDSVLPPAWDLLQAPGADCFAKCPARDHCRLSLL